MLAWTETLQKHSEHCKHCLFCAKRRQNYHRHLDGGDVALLTENLYTCVWCQIMACSQHFSDGSIIPAVLQDHSMSVNQT